MRRWLIAAIGLVGLLALAACAAREEAPAAPAAPAPEVKPTWQQEWEQVLTAAKREGKVTVLGVSGAERRRAFTEPFEKKYGISVEYLGGQGSAQVAKIQTERDAGQYLWDVFISGEVSISTLASRGIVEPIEPALILPEVKDLRNWREGKLLFVKEKERLGLFMTMGNSISEIFNTNLVKPGEVKSRRDLLDPKWKGKIVVGRSPLISGPAQGSFRFYYAHPELGTDFIRSLAKQELTITGEDRLAGEWVATGRAAFSVGIAGEGYEPLREQGLPIAIIDPRTVKEGSHISPSSGGVTLLKNAPHPNAAKVYLNWLLSKEGQTEAAKALRVPSWRADVPWDGDPAVVPQPGRYLELYGEKGAEMRERVLPLLRELFGQ